MTVALLTRRHSGLRGPSPVVRGVLVSGNDKEDKNRPEMIIHRLPT